MRPTLWVLLTGLVVLASTGAEARPRDDVMAGAFRCAAVGELRVWLDCYYGAAQPARAELRLPPAPAAQVQLSIAPPASPANARDTALRDSVIAEAFRCNTRTDERQWLDCYYGAAQQARIALGLMPAPQALPSQMAAAAPMPPAKRSGGWFSGMFGDEPAPVPAEQYGMAAAPSGRMVGRIVARMASYKINRNGIFTVTLENGQTWRQLEGDTDYARWTKPAANYVVTISHGAFGSFNFEVKDNPGLFKVERAK